MTEKEYNEIQAVRRSDLLLLRKSPLHYKYALEHPEDRTTAAKAFGAAAHKFILEPATFKREFAIAPEVDKRTKAGKEAWQEFVQANEGKGIITAEDWGTILDMDLAMRKDKLASVLLKGQVESPYFWTDPETGIRCKIRPDVVVTYQGRPLIVDYKTVTSCDERAFWSECHRYGYDLQAGMYTEGLLQAAYLDASFAFVAQEKTAPYAVRVFWCDPDFVRQGNDEFHEMLRQIRLCEEAHEWPGYAPGYLMPYAWKEVAEDD